MRSTNSLLMDNKTWISYTFRISWHILCSIFPSYWKMEKPLVVWTVRKWKGNRLGPRIVVCQALLRTLHVTHHSSEPWPCSTLWPVKPAMKMRVWNTTHHPDSCTCQSIKTVVQEPELQWLLAMIWHATTPGNLVSLTEIHLRYASFYSLTKLPVNLLGRGLERLVNRVAI